MKIGELRAAYRAVADIGNLGLCNFCKFAEWSGFSVCEMDLDCTHKLADRYGFPDCYDVWEGSDCWAFRPNIDLQQAGIIASISHDNLIPHFGRGDEWIGIIPAQPIY